MGKTETGPYSEESIREMDINGNVVQSVEFAGSDSSPSNSIFVADDGKVCVTGSFLDFVIVGNDSVFGFNPFETFIFTLDQELSLPRAGTLVKFLVIPG